MFPTSKPVQVPLPKDESILILCLPTLQVCDEDGPSLPLDQQLLWPPEPRLLHQLPAAGSAGLLACCHHLHPDHVYAAL